MSSRIERLAELLEEPLLITNPVNILYLTGFDSSNAALFVEPDRVRLFTDFRYIESAQAIEGVEAVQTKRALIAWLSENLAGRFGFEANILPWSSLTARSASTTPLEGVASTPASTSSR